MNKEKASCGDNAIATLNSNAGPNETVATEGHYHVVCRDKDGNVKWEEGFPNLVVAAGKELMLNTLLRTSGTYTTVGPFLGLIGSSVTYSAGDTMVTKGWTEFVNYTVSGSAVRGAPTFSAASSSGTTPTNTTTCAAGAITYTITGGGGTIYGCFLVTGTGAVNTQSSTAGVLYSEGSFSSSKATTSGDTLSVTYSTTATS